MGGVCLSGAHLNVAKWMKGCVLHHCIRSCIQNSLWDLEYYITKKNIYYTGFFVM